MQNVNRIVADNQESVKNSLRNLETFTAALARNSEKIDNVMLRVDGVMGKADSLMLGLNTIAGGAAGGELNLMVKSIRDLAEDLDKRSGALMADGRRTLADISRAVNNFDRNPSRVIFGGSNNAAAGGYNRASAPGAERRQGRGRRAGRGGSSDQRAILPIAGDRRGACDPQRGSRSRMITCGGTPWNPGRSPREVILQLMMKQLLAEAR